MRVSEGSNVNLAKGVVRAKYENFDEVCKGVETQISHLFKNLQKMKKNQRVPPMISLKMNLFFKECWAKTLKKDDFLGNRLS